MNFQAQVSTLALSLVVCACGPTPTPPPTWYKDVLPLTEAQCSGCHAAGGIAPFALDTYEAAKGKADAMAAAVVAKRMPPWLASPDCGGPFVDQRVLTQAQIDTFTAWAKAGAPEGNAADAPAKVASARLPRVDQTLTMGAAYTPSATLRDDYRCFIVDPQLTQSATVTGYDITPGSQAVVHHVILYVVDRAAALAKDGKDGQPGWQCFGGANVNTDGALGAWAPGGAPIVFPVGTGIRIKAGQVLAMQVHYNMDNARVPDQTAVKLMYGTGTEQAAYLLPVVADGFAIPPNAMGYTYSESFNNTYGFPLKLWGFLPHMHIKGTHITLTGGTANECLVDIPKWDFHWQTQYFRHKPFTLQDGAPATIRCTWDNPTDKTVTWGEGTSDEMCFAFVYATL
jgi:hypothetical protein